MKFVGLCKQCATSGHSRPGSEVEVVFQEEIGKYFILIILICIFLCLNAVSLHAFNKYRFEIQKYLCVERKKRSLEKKYKIFIQSWLGYGLGSSHDI